MRFGLFGGAARSQETDDSHGYRQFIDYVVAADELGYYAVFLTEHHFTGFGQVSATLNLMSYLAARTSRIRLGTAVIVLPWHHPLLLTEQANTLDLLSDGRLDLGVGKGYRLNEFRGFGIPLEEAGERYEESLGVMRKAWMCEGRFSHHGRFWNFDDVIVEPLPVQRPHPPLWVGASSATSIRRAAEENLSLLLDQAGSFDLTAERVKVYREAAEESGRAFDPAQVAVTRSLHLAFNQEDRNAFIERRAGMYQRLRDLAYAPDDARRERPEELPTGDVFFTDPRLATENSAILGTPDECIQRLRRLERAGVQQVLLSGGSIETLRTFAKEVMPAFA